MCGRFTLRAPGAEIARHFGLEGDVDLDPRWNIAPTQKVATVRQREDGLALTSMRWGLVPSWAPDLARGARLINARSETVHEKPSFAKAFAERRCLVPTDGFFEWSGEKGARQAWFFHLGDHALFSFAGIWECWEGPDGPLETVAILTTRANSLVEPRHPRMPVILRQDDHSDWLGGGLGNEALFQPFPPSEMAAIPVGSRVHSPRNEGPECILALAGEN